MKLLIKYLLILITSFLVAACHKYPEGGWSNVAIKHLFGANKDGAQKNWKLKLYEVNGIDSTKFLFPNNGFTQYQNDEIVFKITTAKAHDYFAITKIYSYGPHFSNDKKQIYFYGGGISDCSGSICEKNIFQHSPYSETIYWTIRKLTKSEFIITANSYKIILTN